MQAVNRRGFAALVGALLGLSAVLGWAVVTQVQQPNIRMLVIVALVAVALEASPVFFNDDVMLSMSAVVVFFAISLGGLPAALVAGLAVGLASVWTVKADRLLKIGANVGMHVVAAAAAAIAFSSVVTADSFNPGPDDALAHAGSLTVGLLVAAVIYTMTNLGILAMGLTLLSDVPLGRTFRGLIVEVAPPFFLSVGLSAIAYVLYVRAGWEALVFVMVPLLLARRALQTVQHRQEAFDRMVRTFVKAIELKDGYTRGHAERVSDLSVLVAERMGLTYEERQLIRYGAILHDVGKIGVSLGILCKAGPLTDDEFDEMKLHPEIGAEMLADIDFLHPALSIVHHHHERIDGRGYPAGLAGDGIPLLTRVVTAVDAFDAMTSTRSYRRALPVAVAIEELQANAGTQFDTEVVEHLVAVVAEHGWTITDEPVAVATLRPRGVAS